MATRGVSDDRPDWVRTIGVEGAVTVDFDKELFAALTELGVASMPTTDQLVRLIRAAKKCEIRAGTPSRPGPAIE